MYGIHRSDPALQARSQKLAMKFTPLPYQKFREGVRKCVAERLAPFVDEWEEGERLPREALADLGRPGAREEGARLDFGA